MTDILDGRFSSSLASSPSLWKARSIFWSVLQLTTCTYLFPRVAVVLFSTNVDTLFSTVICFRTKFCEENTWMGIKFDRAHEIRTVRLHVAGEIRPLIPFYVRSCNWGVESRNECFRALYLVHASTESDTIRTFKPWNRRGTFNPEEGTFDFRSRVRRDRYTRLEYLVNEDSRISEIVIMIYKKVRNIYRETRGTWFAIDRLSMSVFGPSDSEGKRLGDSRRERRVRLKRRVVDLVI